MNSPLARTLNPMGRSRRRRVVGFSPASIAGLALWLKADAGTFADAGKTTPATVGGTVACWADQSGHGNDATQSNAGFRPTLLSPAGLSFDGVNDVLNFTANPLAGSPAAAAFWVAANGPPGSSPGALLERFGANSDSDHWPFSDGSVYTGFGSTARKFVGTVPGLTDPHAYACRSAAGSWSLAQDATTVYSDASSSVGFGTAPGIGGAATGFYWPGTAREILLYGAVLSDADATAVMAYLKSRWGTP